MSSCGRKTDNKTVQGSIIIQSVFTVMIDPGEDVLLSSTHDDKPTKTYLPRLLQ